MNSKELQLIFDRHFNCQTVIKFIKYEQCGFVKVKKDIFFWKLNKRNESFEKEKSVLLKLNGDTVPKFIDLIYISNKQILITEYLPYPTYEELRETGQLMDNINKEIVKQYIRLNKIYGYFHEDLHQDNILIGSQIWFVDNTSAFIDIDVGVGLQTIMGMYK